ncbi:MAG: lipid-A-disaccharide synthase [Phycisphaerae bacterium]|nr:lipid-A-disaccharide synthase [Phycisphaerae bacterium]
MTTASPTIFLSAAEASGDHHAANLILALREKLPGARFVGATGPEMAAAGCESIIDLTKKASMVLGPIANLSYYHRAVKKIQAAICDIRPDIHVPVDSPALNWHLAKASKKAGIPVLYYVAPQVWAWAPWRIKKVRRLTNHIACLLPFEEQYFRSRGVNATYVGHPLFDGRDPIDPNALPDLVDAWTTGKFRVALLPGSRPGEIKVHAPAFAKVTDDIRERYPDASFTFTAVHERAAKQIRAAVGERGDIPIVVGKTPEVLADSHFALATSGTVTLNVAHAGVPMVIAYKTSLLSYLMFPLLKRTLFRTKSLSLVNILAGRKIVPELMPWNGNIGKLRDEALQVMGDLGYLTTTREKLLELTKPLALPAPHMASQNTADLVVKILSNAKK